jgi:hypothetical protein
VQGCLLHVYQAKPVSHELFQYTKPNIERISAALRRNCDARSLNPLMAIYINKSRKEQFSLGMRCKLLTRLYCSRVSSPNLGENRDVGKAA